MSNHILLSDVSCIPTFLTHPTHCLSACFQATWTTSCLHAHSPTYLMDCSKHSECSTKPTLCQKRSSISTILMAICKAGINNFTASRPNVHTRWSNCSQDRAPRPPASQMGRWCKNCYDHADADFSSNQLFSCFI